MTRTRKTRKPRRPAASKRLPMSPFKPTPWLEPINPQTTPPLPPAVIAAIINHTTSWGEGLNAHMSFRVEERQIFAYQSGMYGASLRFYIVPQTKPHRLGRPRMRRLRVVVKAPQPRTKRPKAQRFWRVVDFILPDLLDHYYDEWYAAVSTMISDSLISRVLVKGRR